jgi:signal transduction histidine kinase/ligand-binding sensor domain-containing protein/CheY-like chemotaxis protein
MRISFSILLLMTMLFSHAQFSELRFQHINTKNGLSNNIIRCIIQDHLGYIWIGTEDGLNRFDGYSNKIFKKILDDTTSLTDNMVYSIYIDTHDDIWVGTQAGLCLYNENKDNFKTYILDKSQYQINTANRVTGIKEDANSNLYIATELGFLYRLNRKTGNFEKDTHNFKSIRDFIIDREGNFWSGGYAGLFRYNRESNELNYWEYFNYNNRSYSVRDVNTIFEEGDTIWIGTIKGRIYYILKSSFEIRPFKYNLDSSYFIYDIFKSRKGLFYFSTANGLYLYSKKTDRFVSYQYQPFDKDGISGHGVTLTYEDMQGNIWLGTFQGGVDLAISGKAFSNYNQFSRGFSLDVINIRAITEDSRGWLWLGSFDKGINVINPKTGEKQLFMPYEKNPYSLPFGTVFTIFEDSRKNIWIGTYLGYLQRYDPQTRSFISYPFYPWKKEASEGRDVRSIIEDKESNLWLISHSHGMSMFDPRTKTFKHYRRDYSNLSNSIADDWAFQLLLDHEGFIWVATPSGLSKFDPKTEKFRNYYHFPNDPGSLCNNFVNVIFEDSNHNLWIGTSYGLDVFNRKNEVFRHFYVKDGLPSVQIKSILEHRPGELWISTGNGLSRMRYMQDTVSGTISATFRNYNTSDNLQDNFFWERSAYKTKEGLLAFGCEKGLVMFNPDEIHDNTAIPKVYITGLRLFNEPVKIGDYDSLLRQNIRLTKEIKFNRHQNYFTIEYVAINYVANENNQYAYMLEGFDKDWIEVGNKREASYTNLDPGRYVFRVKASNNDGYWNEEGASIKITIKPAFIDTIWSKLIILCGIAALVLFFYYYRISILKSQNILLEQNVEKRTEQLMKANFELEEKNKHILAQNEEIIKQNLEIFNKNEEINKQKLLLEKQKNEVEHAYEELALYRDKLEEIVEERTHELMEAKEKAEESDRLKSSFLANLSHEIRTPLNSIIGFSSLIFNEEISDEERKSYQSIIESSSVTLLNLINDIIDFSKIEAKRLEIIITEVPLIKIFNNLKEIYTYEIKKQQLFTAKQLEFRVNIDKNIQSMVIPTDEIRLNQILSNLVNNAIKFTQKGYIEVGCEFIAENETLEFYVKDTGVGIKKEYHEIIFDRFRKVEDDKDTIYRGAGLGLAISRQLIKLLGGDIWVESEPGKGSVFYFSHPVKVAKQPDHEDYAKTSVRSLPSLHDKVILIAEDDYSNFLYIEKLVNKTGAKVFHAADGYEAVEIMKKNPDIDLILMDIKMPGMNGMDALKIIREDFTKVPVIAQTAYVLTEEIKKFYEAGFNDYISKPIKPDDFYSLLNKYFA